ncbi:MAG: hypothetical protein LBP78_01485 [Acidaminococcales bacterium]|nr:hypothetical protein [Acidaminococcales bacterium]
MQKILTLTVLAVFLLCGTAQAQDPPDKIILHSTVGGELSAHPLNCVVRPKKDIHLRAAPYTDSAAIATIPEGWTARITAFELHTFPYKNRVVVGNSVFYFLTYRGEGIYSVWLDGKVQEIEMKTNQFATNGTELWLCLKSPQNGLEGWVRLENMRDWYTEKGSGIFLTPANSRYWS